MSLHAGILCHPTQTRYCKDRYENAQNVEDFKLATVVVQTKNQVDKKDQEYLQIDEKGEKHSLLDSFTESAGLSKNREEAVYVRVSIKDERAGK